jgi:hypothetical protein
MNLKSRRRVGCVLRSALGLLLLFDVLTALRLWFNGIPEYSTLIDKGPGQYQLEVKQIPWRASDSVLVTLFVGLHVALIFLVWRSRKSRLTPASHD